MSYSPSSVVYLLNTPLDAKNTNQFLFASKTDQKNYFYGKRITTLTQANYTFIKKDSVIRVALPVEDLYNVNYCMFQNTKYSDKYFYNFINEVKYVNDNCTDLVIKTDVFQTWIFDITFKKSFVEREHVSDDKIGSNTLPENLPTGPYIYKTDMPTNIFKDMAFVVLYPTTTEVHGKMFGKNYAGFRAYTFDTDHIGNMNDLIESEGTSPIAVYPIPQKILSGTFTNGALTDNTDLVENEFRYSVAHTQLSGYQPKNKKLYCYPYRFLTIRNGNGQETKLKYEDFSSVGGSYQSLKFIISGDIYPDPDLFCMPLSYQGLAQNWGSAFIMSGLPLCCYTTDSFYQWYSQNRHMIDAQRQEAYGSVLAGVASFATMGDPTGITHGIYAVNNSYASMQDQRNMPNQSGGSCSGSLALNYGKLDFYFCDTQIKPEYAKIIDDYFTMYGYKINRVKIPNLHSRSSWNYIKTIDINLSGSVPINDLIELKNIFNTGVTLWHNPATFGDYSQNNVIIGDTSDNTTTGDTSGGKQGMNNTNYHDSEVTNTQTSASDSRMTASTFVTKLNSLLSENTVYLYGGCGQTVSSAVVKAKAKDYPSWYTTARITDLTTNHAGAFGFDCSNMIKSILWGFNNDHTKYIGGAVYGSNNVPDVVADDLFNLCTNKSSVFTGIKPGCAVHISGHIGVYVGNNQAIECTPRWDNKVQKTFVENLTTTPSGSHGRKWDQWGYLPFVNYS